MKKNKKLAIEWGAKIVAMSILLHHCFQVVGLLTPSITATMITDSVKFMVAEMIILIVSMIALGIVSWYSKDRHFLMTSLYLLIVLVIVGLILFLELPYLSEFNEALSNLIIYNQ